MADPNQQEFPTIIGPDASFKGELTFEKGVVVKSYAKKNHQFLKQMLKSPNGAASKPSRRPAAIAPIFSPRNKPSDILVTSFRVE